MVFFVRFSSSPDILLEASRLLHHAHAFVISYHEGFHTTVSMIFWKADVRARAVDELLKRESAASKSQWLGCCT